MKKDNWWKDTKNKDEVERISWWNHPENKSTYPLPFSIVHTDNCWVATCNDDTKKLLGDINGCAQGDTREEAIEKMFMLIRWGQEFTTEQWLNYQRFVPFRKGDWTHIGGKWFVIFGFNFHFRNGSGMKGGRYIPFTKLNISIHSQWAVFRRWKIDNAKQNSSQQ